MPRKPPPPPRRSPGRRADPPPTQRFAEAQQASNVEQWARTAAIPQEESDPGPVAAPAYRQPQPAYGQAEPAQPAYGQAQPAYGQAPVPHPSAPRQPSHPQMPAAGSPPMPTAPGMPPQEYEELLANAPAAVKAAAEQVIAAHREHGSAVQLPPPAPPPAAKAAAKAAGKSDEESGSHGVSLKEGTVVAERYRVERMIGRGGMGTVYAVRHVNTGEKLALKLLHPALAENDSAVERFRTEARAPVRIESDHVVRVVDADVAKKLGNVPFMVMERLRGHDLRADLKRRGALPAGEVVLYLKQVARALDKAHGLGIVHRDLKPANMYVLKREDGTPLVKVLDFGIAKLTDDAARELTVAGQIFGTPWFMAPEQARGDLGKVGPATDRWALGLIAYQLLTGRNYWTADGMAALVAQICYEPMPPPTQTAPHLGPLFDMWFARACNRDPSQRFASSKEMVEELAAALGVNQTGPSFNTAGGMQRHMDSSLQISVPAHAGDVTPMPGMGGSITPGSIPGVGPRMDNTNAPLYSTQQPQTNKRSSSTTAVLLGVVIALIVAGAGAGVWLVLPPAAPAAATPSATAEAAAAKVSDADEPEEPPPSEPTEPAEPSTANSDTAKDEPPPAETKTPVVTPPPPPTSPVAVVPPKATNPQPPKTAPPKPPPPPKVAPKVDKIDF